MPYRLPSPWDPGFALPSNVKDEGLQRRAFVTKQARRGTYDDPKVGDGGYALPQYVRDEGYGRGVYTSAWDPPGSTPGGSVPNYLNQRPQTVSATPLPGGGTKFAVARQASPVAVPGPSVVAFGDVAPGSAAIPAVYKRYGNRVATVILERARVVHPARRTQEIKKTLDAIDPKLYPRAMKATAAYAQAGRKGGQAVHAGLSHAISTTLIEQVITAGKTGRAPRSGLMSLAGCGRRSSMSALGSVPLKAVTSIGTLLPTLQSALLANAQLGPSGITPGTCEATGTYIWDAGGFWRRRMAGETCAVINPNIAGPTTGGAHGGITITGAGGKVIPGVKLAPTIAPGTTKLIQVGPFTFPLVDQMTIHWDGLLPDDWRAAINQQITRDCSPCISSSMRSAAPGTIYSALQKFLGPEMPTSINHDFFGVNYGGGITSKVTPQSSAVFGANASYIQSSLAGALANPTQPLAQTKRPDTGETYALYAVLEPRDASKPFDATSNPWNLRISWRKADSSMWDWIWSVLSTIVDWAGDVISAIGSLTCDILGNPVGQVAVIGAGAAVGGPGGAKAGAAGAGIGAQMCAQPPPAAVAGPSSLMPLAIIGAGLAAALLLIPKKKKAP